MELRQLIKKIEQRIELIDGASDNIPLGENVSRLQHAFTLRKEYVDILGDLYSIQTSHTSNSFVVIRRDEDDQYVISGDASYVCHMACKCEIFSDCTNESIVKLVIDGDECIPPSWEPDMIRRVIRKRDGEMLFENQYLNWNH